MTTRTTDVELAGGYAMQVVGTERRLLHLQAPDGTVCLTISLRPGGPAVELSAASLRVATTGDLTLDCERLQVNARDRIELVSGADIALDAGGNVTTRADGEIATEADGQQHRARLGNIDLAANDDVSLQGERVRLNSPQVLSAPRVEMARADLTGTVSPSPPGSFRSAALRSTQSGVSVGPGSRDPAGRGVVADAGG